MDAPLDAMTIRVVSPDKQIQARIENRKQIRVVFRPGAYAAYDDEDLAHQLGQLATLGWTAYLRGYRQAVDKAGRTINVWDAKRRRYREELTKIKASAQSQDKTMRAQTVGLVRWRFKIAPGTVSGHEEQWFLAALEATIAATIADYEQQVVILKDEYFRFDLPPKVRRHVDKLTELAEDARKR